MKTKISVPFAMLFGFALTLSGADQPKAGTFLTIETAGPDYAVQGEYVNDWGGAQVIALGEDKFRMVLHKGGLPGAGWDGSDKTEIEGKREGGVVVFADPNGWSHKVKDGEFVTTTDQGDNYTMRKTTRTSPTIDAKPPAGAIVLFDGSNADAWSGAHLDERHLLASGCSSKQQFGSYTLHAEFLLPFKPLGRGQDRGNSGVYMQDRYEVQVLDSFGLKGENNECGGIYSKLKPKVNMCLPPLTWQTYDIDFEAAQFDATGKKTKNAVITVKHNGVLIHDHQEINGPTGGGKPETPTPGAIQLQGHGNPVFYRNLWLVEKK